MVDSGREEPTMSRVKTSVAGHPFEMEGPAADVMEHYKMFIETVQMALQAQSAPVASTADSGAPAASRDSLPGRLSANPMDRVFHVVGDVVSLKRVPNSKGKNADALLMLLYGYHKLRDAEWVLGTRLMKSAKLTGLKIDRVDRFFGPNTDYIETQGQRRGKKYKLNAQGAGRAEQFIEALGS